MNGYSKEKHVHENNEIVPRANYWFAEVANKFCYIGYGIIIMPTDGVTLCPGDTGSNLKFFIKIGVF